MVVLDKGDQFCLECCDFFDVELVEEPIDASKGDDDLLLDGDGSVLGLLEEFSEACATVEDELGGWVQVRAKLRECGDLAVLGKEKLQAASDLLHGLDLGGGSNSRDGKTHVDGWTDALEKKLGLQEDLSIGDGDDVCWDVRRDIAALGFNDGEGREGSTARLFAHFSGTLKEAGVEVKDIAGIRFAAWRATEQETHLAVGYGLLGEVVVYDEGVLAVIPKVLSNCTARIGRKVLQRRSLRGGGGHDDRVLESVVLFQGLYKLGNRGALLADGNVYTKELFVDVVQIVPFFLVDYSVQSDGSLSCLTITNDQLALPSPYRHHGVDGFYPCLHRLAYRLPRNDSWGFYRDALACHIGQGALTVRNCESGIWPHLSIDWVAEGINYSSQETLTNWHVDNVPRATDNVTLFDEAVVAKNDNSDIVRLQVQGHPLIYLPALVGGALPGHHLRTGPFPLPGRSLGHTREQSRLQLKGLCQFR